MHVNSEAPRSGVCELGGHAIVYVHIAQQWHWLYPISWESVSLGQGQLLISFCVQQFLWLHWGWKGKNQSFVQLCFILRPGLAREAIDAGLFLWKLRPKIHQLLDWNFSTHAPVIILSGGCIFHQFFSSKARPPGHWPGASGQSIAHFDLYRWRFRR